MDGFGENEEGSRRYQAGLSPSVAYFCALPRHRATFAGATNWRQLLWLLAFF